MGSAPHAATGPLPAWRRPECVRKAHPHLLSLPSLQVGEPWLGTDCPRVPDQDSTLQSGPLSPAILPCSRGCRWSAPQPAPSRTLTPVPARQSSPRARFPEMKRKKQLSVSPRSSLQPRWHPRSLGAASQAGPGASLRLAMPGLGPVPGPLSHPCSGSAPPPALSLLRLPLPKGTLGACFSRTLSPSLFWSASLSLSLSFSPLGLILPLGSSGLPPLPALLALLRHLSRGQLPPAAPCSRPGLAGPFTLCLAPAPRDPKLTLLGPEAPAASWAESGVGLAPQLPTPMRRDCWCDFWLRV